MKGAASHGLHGPASCLAEDDGIAYKKAKSSRHQEMWYKGGVGVSQ